MTQKLFIRPTSKEIGAPVHVPSIVDFMCFHTNHIVFHSKNKKGITRWEYPTTEDRDRAYNKLVAAWVEEI